MAATPRLFSASLMLAAGLVSGSAIAAESYDNCTGFIESLPTVITTQGTWCLRRNLSTGITSGNAVTIAANNITIDCNDFKLGGLVAGDNSKAIGIYGKNRHNATVRHCNVRGFRHGIYLHGVGHLVEDNRFDNNLAEGIHVFGDTTQVLRNAVYDTGGLTGGRTAIGIMASGSIVGNTVSGLLADEPGRLVGIEAHGTGTQVRRNRIANISSTAAQGGAANAIVGIDLLDPDQRASGNQVVAGSTGAGSSEGIAAHDPSFCLDNTVGGFVAGIDSICTGPGNETLP